MSSAKIRGITSGIVRFGVQRQTLAMEYSRRRGVGAASDSDSDFSLAPCEVSRSRKPRRLFVTLVFS